MENINQIAEKVLSKTSIDKEQKFGSVIAIIMIIAIIVNVVRVIQECEKKNSENLCGNEEYAFFKNVFKEYSSKRKWFNSMRLKKIIRRHLSPEEYKKYKTEIHDAILDTGLNISIEETQTLMEAANND